MNKPQQSSFIDAAIACFDRLSECPALKNYRIYREPGTLPHQPIQGGAAPIKCDLNAAMPARHRSGKWVLVVSAKRSGKGRPLVVNVQVSR